MINLMWKPYPGADLSKASKEIQPVFKSLDTTDTIDASLDGYRRVQVCTAEEAIEMAQELEALGIADKDTIEFQGNVCGWGDEAEPTFPTAVLAVDPEKDDLFSKQLYLQPRKADGVDALAAWRYQGGRGRGVQIVDIETAGVPDHPDLAHVEPLIPWSATALPPRSAHHVAQVLGIVCADDDGDGVVGLASDATVWVAQSSRHHEALHPLNVLRYAVSRVSPPAVILVELTASFPRVHRKISNETVHEQLPLELWAIGRDVLGVAREKGIYVVQAAGNEGRNLDKRLADPRKPERLFDSGSIVVGAAKPHSRRRLDSSNWGTRVNLSCWGAEVTTCDIRDRVATYTHSFGQTSAAAAIVAGCVACIAGVVKASGRKQLSPDKMRDLLVLTGYWPNQKIGPRPNLAAALKRLESKGELLSTRNAKD